MKEWFNRGEKNEHPQMKKKGDVYLFGVTHDVEITDKKVLTYSRRVKNADHLLLEGNKSRYGYSRDYENAAYALFQEDKKESVHFLEEGYDSTVKLAQYGVNEKDVIVYYSYSSLLSELEALSKGPVDLVKDMQKITDSLKENYPALKQNINLRMTVLNACGNMQKLVSDNDPTTPYVPKGKVVLQLYNAAVRDYEVLGPRINELTESLPGKKAIFIGRYHMPNMETVLNGQEIPQPLPWDEYAKTLPAEDQKAVKAFQAVSQSKLF